MARVCLALAAATWNPGRPAWAQEDLLSEIRTIAAVRFEGRQRVSARELRSVMKTRPPSLWPWRERPVLRPDFLRSDTLAIHDRYLHHGYLDARAGFRIRPTRDSSQVVVTFVIHEGARSRVASVEFTGVRSHPEGELRRKLLAQPGQPFDPWFLQLDTLKISELYQERGFRPHVAASARRRPGADSLRVDVRYHVDEGPQYLVGEVYVRGYQKVSERLVRRELVLKRDDVYRRSRMVRSGERLYDTGLFSQVQISPIVDSTFSRMEFDLRVSERRPRWIDAGIGSGSAERFRATGQWGHRNVLGRGFQGALSSRIAFNGSGKFLLSRTELSLLEPWLLRTRTRAVVTPSYERSDDRADPRWLVEQDARGVRLEVGRELNRFSRATISQNNAWVHQDLTLFADTLAAEVRDSLERTVVSRFSTHSIALGGVRDYRDNPLAATRGSMQAITGELAGGPLKGTSSFRKVELVSAWYTPFANGWVLATRVRAGAIQPTGDAPAFSLETGVDSAVARVPLGDRFRTGGVNSIRGYDENSIPPSGGLAILQANAELRIPLAGFLGLEVFIDAGNAWARPSYIKGRHFIPKVNHDVLGAGDVRYVFGFGPRLNLPIGPLRFDITWSPRPFPDPLSQNPRWLIAKPQFAIGPSF